MNRQIFPKICRSPGQCPVADCDQVIFPSGLLIHYLHKHANERNNLTEIYEKQPVPLELDPHNLVPGKPTCLSLLMYAGIRGYPISMPARRFLNIPNAGLMQNRKRWSNHLPVMVMVCRTTWYAMLPDKRLEKQLVSMNATSAGIYVLWLVSPVTTRKVSYTLTVFDQYSLGTRRVIRSIRNYTHSQNPSDFLPFEVDYLVLRDSEVADILNVKYSLKNKTPNGCIQLQVVINENPPKIIPSSGPSIASSDISTILEPPIEKPKELSKEVETEIAKSGISEKEITQEPDESDDNKNLRGILLN